MLIATLNRTRDLVPDDLAVIRLDGTLAEGDPGAMSTEVVAMHTEVYRARPQAGAVIHTHSPHLLAFALAGRSLPGSATSGTTSTSATSSTRSTSTCTSSRRWTAPRWSPTTAT